MKENYALLNIEKKNYIHITLIQRQSNDSWLKWNLMWIIIQMRL